MRPRVVALACFVVCAVVAACGAFGADDAVSPVPPAGDAATEAAPSEAGPGLDAGADADGCAADNPALSDFSTGAGWVTRGDATINIAPGDPFAYVTPDAHSMLGALWWDQRVHLDDFELTFQMRVRGGGDSSEGLAFVWTAAPTAPTYGATGANLGACGLPSGWAVLFSMVKQPSTPSTLPVRIVETAGCTGSPAVQVPATSDTFWHDVSIVVKGGQLDLLIDSAVRITKGAVTNFRAVDGYWGFTGTTGAASGESHEIRAVKMTLTNQPRCTR
jgi:hypothetical protein